MQLCTSNINASTHASYYYYYYTHASLHICLQEQEGEWGMVSCLPGEDAGAMAITTTTTTTIIIAAPPPPKHHFSSIIIITLQAQRAPCRVANRKVVAKFIAAKWGQDSSAAPCTYTS